MLDSILLFSQSTNHFTNTTLFNLFICISLNFLLVYMHVIDLIFSNIFKLIFYR